MRVDNYIDTLKKYIDRYSDMLLFIYELWKERKKKERKRLRRGRERERERERERQTDRQTDRQTETEISNILRKKIIENVNEERKNEIYVKDEIGIYLLEWMVDIKQNNCKF